jgi:hypothetical protein
MNEITKTTGYEYNMYVSPNGYGFNFHGRWTGIVGEIVKKVNYLSFNQKLFQFCHIIILMKLC